MPLHKIRYGVEIRPKSPDLLFSYYYLDNKRLIDRISYEIKIDIQVEVKWYALLSSSGWDYYKWVDAFLSQVESSISEKAFFDDIHWNSALTVLHCQERAKQESESLKGRT